MMRVAPDEYLRLPLRAHELLRAIPLYDVSIVDLPGGGEGRTIADIRALDRRARPSAIATVLYGTRRFFGRVFGWDGQMQIEDSMVSRLSEDDRKKSEVAPGTRDGAFITLYQH